MWAPRLSRILVGCYPRRWRQRYAEEMLAVLEQHRPSPRTVVDLLVNAAGAYLDPAYRGERHLMVRLRRPARIAAAVAAPPLLVFGLFTGCAYLSESSHHASQALGVDGIALSADGRLMVSSAGEAEGSTGGIDTVWDITDASHPRQLSRFLGGAPSALSPDGRTAASVSFTGHPVLWNLADPHTPVKLATLHPGPDKLWAEAFSPDGHLLAAVYTKWIHLWNVTDPTHPTQLATLPAQVTHPSAMPSDSHDIAFSPDGHTLASATGVNEVTLWDISDPARATRIRSIPGTDGFLQAIAFSPDGRRLATISDQATVSLRDLADPTHPTMTRNLLPDAMFPGGKGQPDQSCNCTNQQFALGLTPQRLIVVVDRYETPPNPAARDTVFSWTVTETGTANGPTITTRDGQDGQPALTVDGRAVADGAAFGTPTTVRLWVLP